MEHGQKTVKKSVRYSQNFLKNPQLIQKLVEQSSVEVSDTVLDIGSGKGIITDILSAHCKKVVSIEADDTLIDKLKQKYHENPRVVVQPGDFFTFDLPTEQYKVFSNIPFNRTADIIRRLINNPNPPVDTYLIVQKEAAFKFMGSPMSKESLFSTTIKPWYELSIEHNFQRSDFDPHPSIDIVLLRIKKRELPLVAVDQVKQYKDFVSYAFNRSNPNLKKGLKDVFTSNQFSRIIQSLHVSDSVVPTQLSFDQWLQLFRSFIELVDTQKKQVVAGSASKMAKEQTRIDKVHRTRVSRSWKDEAIF